MSRIASSLVSALVALGPDLPEPLYRQLYNKLRTAILTGHLAPGIQLPSSRELARELTIGRNTVLSALEQLIAEGYLQGTRGSGTYVTSTLPDDATLVPKSQRTETHLGEKRQRPPLNRTGVTGVWFPQLPDGPLRPFRPGLPAVDDFPVKLWVNLLQKHWKRGSRELLGIGNPLGLLRLRRAVAAYLTAARAVRCDVEQVVIVSGAQQALDTTARLLTKPGDTVWIEEPGYLGMRAALQTAGACVRPVPVDDEGLNVRIGIARYPNARLVYVTPSHQFPLGITMSLTRRLELLSWAQQTGAWIVEDDYDSEYRYRGRPLASLQGLDAHERVIYVGTFSKVLFPSLRLGYLVLPRSLVDDFVTLRTIASGQLPLIEQSVLAEFMEEGHFGRHLRRMRMLYAERQAVLHEEVHRQLTGVFEIQPNGAGMHTIGWLTGRTADHEVAKAAFARGVEVIPLTSFYATRPKRNGLILGFSAFDRHQLRDGVKKLAKVLESVQGVLELE